MTSCPATQSAPLRCPTLEESIQATVALLPRGRAWPVNDGGGTIARFLTWLSGLAGKAPPAWPVGYVQAGFFCAIGALRNFVEGRLCALRLEFWCASMSETRDLWMREYGLPDPCDPFPDLCTKVAAIGGATCAYFNFIIARIGWRAQCYEIKDHCGTQFGCNRFGARVSVFGGASYLGLIVKVHTGEPNVLPSVIRNFHPPRFGAFRFGQHPACDSIVLPSIAPVRCLMDRIAPAHVQIQYVT